MGEAEAAKREAEQQVKQILQKARDNDVVLRPENTFDNYEFYPRSIVSIVRKESGTSCGKVSKTKGFRKLRQEASKVRMRSYERALSTMRLKRASQARLRER